MDNKLELQSNNVDLQGLINLANELPDKMVLPELSNPALAENIQVGYEAVDGEGNLIVGIHEEATLVDLLPSMENPAMAENVQAGFEVVGQDGEVVVGTYVEPTLTDLLPELESPAGASQVLAGYDAIGADGSVVNGGMTNNGAVSQTLSAGGSYTIPAGYHDGSGKVSAKSLTSNFTSTTLTSSIKWTSDKTTFTLPKSGLVLGSTLFFGNFKIGYTSFNSSDDWFNETGTTSVPSISGTTLTIPCGYYCNHSGQYWVAGITEVTIYYI